MIGVFKEQLRRWRERVQCEPEFSACECASPSRRYENRGFTLVELLIVTAVLAILAGFAATKVADIKYAATVSVLESDLKNVVIAQEVYYAETGGFFRNEKDPNGNKPAKFTGSKKKLGVSASPNTKLSIRGNKNGWTARAQHKNRDGFRCALFMGDIRPFSPATHEGVIQCDPRKRKKNKKAKK